MVYRFGIGVMDERGRGEGEREAPRARHAVPLRERLGCVDDAALDEPVEQATALVDAEGDKVCLGCRSNLLFGGLP